MTQTNIPERPFFTDVLALEREIAEKRAEVKQLYKDAGECEAIGKNGVKTLRLAVKRAIEESEKRQMREEREDNAKILLESLGSFIGTPLGIVFREGVI